MNILTDLNLARRLEEAEAFGAEAFVRVLSGHQPGADLVVEQVAGGRAVFAGPGSPLTEAKAIGLHEPVADADLDRMEAVFFSRGEPARVIVCPLADPSLIDALGRRGYRLTDFENILARPLPPEEPSSGSSPRLEASITVRRVEPGEERLYASVTGPNFAGPAKSIDAAVEMIATMIEMPHATAFLAFVDGQAVGGGAVLTHQGLALMAGAATLPPFRNRGVHEALHHARLAFAAATGCDLAAQGAQPGSTSQRNAERRGFQVIYTRAVLVRNPP